MRKLIPNFKKDGLWVKTFNENGYQHTTESFMVWNSMMHRCEVGGKLQQRAPTYIGCTTSENFQDFQYFVEWHQKQVGFGRDGYQLDKDLLKPKNKCYHEDCCVLVPAGLNAFISIQNKKSKLPLGVQKSLKKFRSMFMAQGVVTCLGSYETAELAFEAYRTAKNNEARRWAQRLREGEFLVDFRVISRLDNFDIVDYLV